MNSERMTNDEIWLQLQAEMNTALEYGKLLSLPHLSSAQANRLEEILEQAINNSVLHFYLTEVDHFVSHHLGLLDEDDRESYKDQQALVKEYLGHTICQTPIREALEQSMTESKSQTNNDLALPLSDEEDYYSESTLNQVYH